MEDCCLPGTPHPPSAADIVCDHELTRSNSDASSLTAENCQDIFRRSENETAPPVDRTAWTDEKHNLYLHHLEASFVKQLHQTKRLLAKCSEQNLIDINVSRKRSINVNNASEKFNILRNCCSQKTDCVRGDTYTSLKSKGLNNCKEFLKLSGTVKHGKKINSHGLATRSKELSSNTERHMVLFDLNKEGTGQNFLYDYNRSTSNIESRAKRLKTALADSSSQDQIVPSGGSPTYDSVINSPTLGEETNTS
ncbi:hypothetical protein ABFX02_02G035000 [Erythranthe guttata]